MKADLHIHSNFSDGISSPQEIVRAAIEKNINCICITDHQEVKGAIEAMRFGFDKDILVIPGIEITTKSGDILGINVKKIIPNKLSVQETVKEIRKQEGIAVIPHFFAWFPKNFRGGKEEFLVVDAIEVFNASLFNFLNKKALNLSKKYNLPLTAGSDAHRAEFVGRGYLEIPKDIFSGKDLIKEIIENRVEAKGKVLNPWEMARNLLIKGSIYDFSKKFFNGKGQKEN